MKISTKISVKYEQSGGGFTDNLLITPTGPR